MFASMIRLAIFLAIVRASFVRVNIFISTYLARYGQLNFIIDHFCVLMDFMGAYKDRIQMASV